MVSMNDKLVSNSSKISYKLYDAVLRRRPSYDSLQYGVDKPFEVFQFQPEKAFRPLGLFIYDGVLAEVMRIRVGNQDQLVGSGIPWSQFSSRGIPVSWLEIWVKTGTIQYELASRGLPKSDIQTVDITDRFTIDMSAPVGRIVVWGIELDNAK